MKFFRKFSASAGLAVFSLLAAGLPVSGAAPTVVATDPAPGSVIAQLNQIEVNFDQAMQGVDASDLLINGVPAENLSFGVDGQFIFEFPQPATGTVFVAWAPTHGITDLAVPPNAFPGGSWSYVLDPNAAFTQVRINEFLADNENGIRDEDGSRQDWIEIYNGASTPVDLSGWYLTDNSTALRGWQFPTNIPVQVPGNGYLLVWASGKNRKTNLSALHTDFQLSKSGEYLGLVLPDGATVVSSFAPVYPPQQSDVSYGRDRLDPSIVGFYSTPTPNAPNATSGATGFASEVIYSRPSGTFENAFTLSLSTKSSTAVIRYILVTTNVGILSTNIPTTSSPVYSGPITISQSCQVRARAFETGSLPSEPKTQVYIQIDASVRNFSSDLPICIVHNLGAGTVPSTPQAGMVMLFDNAYDRASPTNAPQVATRMGFHLRGSSTLGNAKSNYRLEYWDEFNQDRDLPFLDMPEESDWVLYGINQFDPGLMHNAIFYWLGRQVPGQTSSRTRFVEVFRKLTNGAVTTNDYFGLYLAVETPKQGKDRLDIKSLEVQNTNAPAITGGYMMKIDRSGALYNWTPTAVTSQVPGMGSIGNTPAAINIEEPKLGTSVTDPRRLAQVNYLRGYIGAFITNLASATYTNPVTGYAQYLDADQWVDNLIVNIIPFNVDGYRLSGYFYKDRNDRMKQGPLWDCDRCLGTGGTGATPNTDNRCFSPLYWRLPATDVNTDNGTDFFGVSNVGVNWFRPLFRDPDFWQKFIDRYQALRTNQFTGEAIVNMVDGFYREIKEAQVREQARWGSAAAAFTYPRSGVQTVSGYTFDFGPADNFNRGRFTNEVNFQKKWLLDRLHFMDTNFVAMPTINRGGGQVSAGTTVTVVPAAEAGSVLYYTLDGTDPRLSGGAISPSAILSAGAAVLTINNNARLVARTYNSGHSNMVNRGNDVGKPLINSFWSGAIDYTFYTTVPTLRITELMYHPANPPTGNTNDPDNFEYIEVRNTGAAPLNVNGMRLRGGVDFLFPDQTLAPGQYAVLVRNVASFQSRYGSSATILGSYTNNLGNSGDHLVLEGALKEPILDFNYSDNWYPITDGAGFSLQIVNDGATNTSWGLKASWRPSGVVGGTPGTGDGGPPTIAAVYINEALTHTDPSPGDAIELYNSTGSPVNVGDWYLTDDFSQPKKYRIPNPTTIPANGYAVFYQSNSFGVGLNGFALSSKGDEVYVFSGDASGNLTGWYHGFDFGAQANGATFGRFVISTGGDQFPTQTTPTLGATNSGPKIGPIVISEINYQPPDFAYPFGIAPNFIDEYIELHNISGSPVPLYDLANPANTWKLRDAVDYVFPQGVTVPAGGYVIVVSFDPTDTVALQRFTAANGVTAGTMIYGPWNGVLDNAGDSVELARPDLPDPPGTPTAGFVPYIEVDKVNYQSAAPWPSGGGLGASLQRINVNAYGNDPANWRFVVTSPGAAIPTGTVVQITQQPQNTTALETRTAVFNIVVTGPPPIRYQWHFGDQLINGAVSSTLIIDNVRLDQAGQYGCFVINPGGIVSSALATLTVLPAAKFIEQPKDVSVKIRPDPGSAPTTNASFSVQVFSQNPPVTYQWRFNDTDIPGATASVLTVVNVTTNSYGRYSCVVTDGNGTVYSDSATLYPLITPVFTVQPLAQTVPAGSLVGLSAQHNGFPGPFTNEWRLGSTGVNSNSTNITEFGIATFTFRAPVTNGVTTRFNLVVKSRARPSGVQSALIDITTISDTDGDGIPDSIETALGLDPNNAADGNGDLDGDKMTNRAEFIAGTDPQNPNSYLKVQATANAGVVNLLFRAVAVRTYTIQYKDDLNSAVWQKLTDVVADTTDRDVTITDNASRPGRMYRVATPAIQ